MASMSYCRFRNTNMELDYCLSALEDGEKLSGEELFACKSMFTQFFVFCEENGIIEDVEWKEHLEEFIENITE